MENLEKYKSRFYNLMESTMGDVKPLITEDIDYQPAQTFFQEVFSTLGKKFPDKVKWNTNINQIQVGNQTQNFIILYNTKEKYISWIDNTGRIVKQDGTNFLKFFDKDKQTQQLKPKDATQLKKDIENSKKLIFSYDLSGLPNSSTPPIL
jgi:lipopolysaccharide export LptBFGC system permease protein LptF